MFLFFGGLFFRPPLYDMKNKLNYKDSIIDFFSVYLRVK